jgi:hypothetical protein
VQYLHTDRERDGRTYILISSLAVYAHFYFAFLIVAQWLALRLQAKTKHSKDIRNCFYWIAAFTSPVFLFAATTGVGPLRWIQRPTRTDLYTLFQYFAGNGGWLLLALSLIAAVIGISQCGRRFWRRWAPFDVWRYQFLLSIILVPIFLVYFLSYARPLFLPRYFIACQPAFLILVAAGIARIPRFWIQVGVVLFLSALGLCATFQYYQRDFDLARADSQRLEHRFQRLGRPRRAKFVVRDVVGRIEDSDAVLRVHEMIRGVFHEPLPGDALHRVRDKRRNVERPPVGVAGVHQLPADDADFFMLA